MSLACLYYPAQAYEPPVHFTAEAHDQSMAHGKQSFLLYKPNQRDWVIGNELMSCEKHGICVHYERDKQSDQAPHASTTNTCSMISSKSMEIGNVDGPVIATAAANVTNTRNTMSIPPSRYTLTRTGKRKSARSQNISGSATDQGYPVLYVINNRVI